MSSPRLAGARHCWGSPSSPFGRWSARAPEPYLRGGEGDPPLGATGGNASGSDPPSGPRTIPRSPPRAKASSCVSGPPTPPRMQRLEESIADRWYCETGACGRSTSTSTWTRSVPGRGSSTVGGSMRGARERRPTAEFPARGSAPSCRRERTLPSSRQASTARPPAPRRLRLRRSMRSCLCRR